MINQIIEIIIRTKNITPNTTRIDVIITFIPYQFLEQSYNALTPHTNIHFDSYIQSL